MKLGKICGMVVLVADAICSAMATFPAYAERTVAITAYDDATREVSLAFGGTSAVAENVYLAYGPADCGGHFHKWPNSVNIGTIATDATSMTYVLPATITTGTYYRFFVGDCPYDAELEYIKGDKTSWLLTNYTPSSANRVETEIFFETINTATAGIETIYSARNTSAKATFTTLQSSGKLRVDRKDSIDQSASAITIPPQTHYTVSIDYSAETITTNLAAACGMKAASAGAYTAGGYLALFTINGNGFAVNENSPIERGGGFRMYWFKMYDTSTGNLDIDLIPVIVNGSPCMYDKVSGNVLPRLGAAGGAFTAGREISVAVASTQTCLFGGTVTVESVNFSTGEISLSFPSLPANATIWAVYSTSADAGAYSPNGWDRYVRAADVAAGATSATFTLQDLAGVSDAYQYKALRFVMAWDSGKTTPYDYQVEYIYATTPNYVDTGIVPNSTDTVAAKVNIRSVTNINIPLWSARYASNNRTLTCFATSTKKFRFDRYNSYATSTGTFNLNEDYVLKADYKTRIYQVAGNINGNKYGLFTNPGDFTPGSSLYLFAANNSGSVSGTADNYLYWFTLQLWDGSLRRDLIPVVKDGAACLYDKVTDAIMTQTGTFTVGARAAKRYGIDAIMTSDLCIDERTGEAPAYARMVSDGAGGWNWKFYTLEMNEIASPSISVPDSTVTVLLGSPAEVSATLADRTANGWTAGGYKMSDFTLDSDGYAFPAGLDFTPIEGVAIDLVGHDFTLPVALRDTVVAFTVTNSLSAGTGGRLFFDIGDGETYTNELITLTGSLELVKVGAGEFFAAKTGQTYTGGTAVSNGVFTVGGNGDTGVLGAGGAVTVGTGATLEMNGKINFLDHPLVLAGGTFANGGKKANGSDVVPTTDSTFSNICVTADSSVFFKSRYGFSSQVAPGTVRLDLGGHTLHTSCNSDYMVWFDLKDVTVENGTIVTVLERATFSFRGDCVATNGVTLDCSSILCNMGNSAKLLNYTDRTPAANYTMGNDLDILEVYGAFTPTTAYWHGLTLVDGATLDLSQTEGAFPIVSGISRTKNLRFAEGATITVALTNRADLAAIAASNAPYVVAWTSTNFAPAGVTFQLDAATAAAGYAIAQDDYGIVLADAAAQATPFYAKLVKGEGDEYSWRFYNSLWNDITATAGVTAPNSGITVWFESGAELAAIDADRAANGWTARGYHTTGFDVPSDGCGVSSAIVNLVLSENATIDLKGHDFTLPESALTADAKFTVTDSSPDGEGGTLTVVVSDAATVFDNYNISFTGSLSFAKDGEGTFTERKNGHTYTGDVTIKGGKVRTVGHGNDGVLGVPCTVTVEEGATLDFCGRYRFGGFKFVLDGGTLLTTSLSYSTSFDTETSITDLRLTKDSYFTVPAPSSYRYGMYAAGERTYLDLGGHKLTINSNTYFDLINTTIENGTIEMFGSGSYSMLVPRHTVIATNNVTFIIHNNINFYGDADKYTDLSNYVAMEDNIGIASSSKDVLRIWGTFEPHGTKYHGLTMMDGSTLDLSNVNEALPSPSALGTTAHAWLKFADDATIRVNVGDRQLRKGDYLVTWTAVAKPTNLNTVKFKCAGSRSFKVEADDTGLRFIPTGFLIIVK